MNFIKKILKFFFPQKRKAYIPTPLGECQKELILQQLDLMQKWLKRHK